VGRRRGIVKGVELIIETYKQPRSGIIYVAHRREPWVSGYNPNSAAERRYLE
jgi:hypothetical protein